MRHAHWDIYEAVLLLEGYLDMRAGIVSRSDVVRRISRQLRQLGKNRGADVNETFRNENGISMNLHVLEIAFEKRDSTMHTAKIFSEAVDLYRSSPQEYNNILKDAKDLAMNEEITERSEQSVKHEKDYFFTVDFSEDFNLAFTKPVSFLYAGEKYVCDKWRLLYFQVCSFLYTDYKHIFARLARESAYGMGNIIVVDKNHLDKLNHPMNIGGAYYVETNKSATDFVRNIKLLLDECGVEYEKLKIRYVEESDVKPAKRNNADKNIITVRWQISPPVKKIQAEEQDDWLQYNFSVSREDRTKQLSLYGETKEMKEAPFQTSDADPTDNEDVVLSDSSSEEPQTANSFVLNNISDFNYYAEINPDSTLAELLRVDKNVYRDITVEALILSSRAANCLQRNLIYSVSDVLAITYSQLKEIRNMGVKTLNEILTQVVSFVRDPANLEAVRQEQQEKESEIKNTGPVIEIDDHLRTAVDSILMGESYSVIELTEDQIAYCEKAEIAVEELGAEICLEAYSSPIQVKTVCAALCSFNPWFFEKQSVEDLIRKLSDHIRKLRASPFAEVYSMVFQDSGDLLLSVFRDDVTVEHIPDLIYKLDEDDDAKEKIKQLNAFALWLDFDFDNIRDEILKKIRDTGKANSERYYDVLKRRASGETLQSISDVYGLTRERVRQIESKTVKRANFQFQRGISGYNLILLVYALKNKGNILNREDLAEFLGDELASVIIHVIKQAKSTVYYFYSDSFETIIIKTPGTVFSSEEEFLSKIKEITDAMPDSFPESDRERIIIELSRKNNISSELIASIIERKYQLSGSFYHYGRWTVPYMCSYVLKEHFPNGFKIADDSEANQFRQYMVKYFGEKASSITNRALDAKVSEVGVLCGRGKYISKKDKWISSKLSKKLFKYIMECDSPILFIGSIFSIFEEELEYEGIDNRFYLQGILRELFGDKLYFRRDYVSRDKEIPSVYSAIVEYIKASKYPVRKEELKAKYKGITDIIISFATSDNDILNYFGEYMHGSNLVITKTEKDYLSEYLLETLSDEEIHHIKDIYAEIVAVRPELFSRNAVIGSYSAFSVLEYLFRDQYQFLRPYIALNSVEIGRPLERLNEFLSYKDVCPISDITDFARENHLTFQSLIELINSFNDRFLLLDIDTVASIDKIGMDSNMATEVENLICNEISGTIPIRDLQCLSKFPKINVLWNEWLVYSILKKWSSKLDVALSSTQLRQSVPLVSLTGNMDSERFRDITTTSNLIKIDNMDDIDDLLADILIDDLLEET